IRSRGQVSVGGEAAPQASGGDASTIRETPSSGKCYVAEAYPSLPYTPALVVSGLWNESRTRYLPARPVFPFPAERPRGFMSELTEEALLQAPRIRTEIPGPKSRQLTAAESRHLAPGVQSLATLSGIAVARAEGSVIEDVDGNRFIDLAAGICVN